MLQEKEWRQTLSNLTLKMNQQLVVTLALRMQDQSAWIHLGKTIQNLLLVVMRNWK